MSNPIIKFHNAETGEIIEREMNDEEYAQHQADQQARELAKAEEASKAQAREALLEKLGITADEAKLLLS